MYYIVLAAMPVLQTDCIGTYGTSTILCTRLHRSKALIFYLKLLSVARRGLLFLYKFKLCIVFGFRHNSGHLTD